MLTAGEILENKGNQIISVDIEATVADALKLMLENRIGSVLITENGEIKGIWTERDLMKNVVTEGFYSKTTKIKEVMTTNLISSSVNDSVYQLMDKFLQKRLRHLLIEQEGKYIGILSSGDITRAQLMLKSQELDELNKMADWDYYENWKWNKKQP
ncbi:MAG: CBS domain-containing protein [Ignavibacteriae bacterium]|nr:CBS domain-containing protein [Ignavibacteriota bacterium]MCB9206495.1 CBS domain-containing protein [Ignavibacteriales bacterium]MCB9211219.1 CBS domain-containing protein [Ignavibacteriales bacterium]MCB9219418.1 CBS domain-containing protein [Ignavibacteriales bacterium]MCB9259908.1 CBS domain-containing protein [Ignavibacteriales bacterium]